MVQFREKVKQIATDLNGRADAEADADQRECGQTSRLTETESGRKCGQAASGRAGQDIQ